MDKAARRAKLKAWKAEKQADARTALPLPEDEMRALFNLLDAELPKQGCDHTRRITEAWLRERKHDLPPVLAWLDNNGGFCDCEVLANSEERFLFAVEGGIP